MRVSAKILSFLIFALLSSLAFAEGPAAQGPSAIGQIIMLGGFVLIFYFLLWRPQSKRAKEHRNLVAGLNKGDEVVTNGGVAGKITKVSEDFIAIEVADGVEIKVQKVSVSAALPKGTLKSV